MHWIDAGVELHVVIKMKATRSPSPDLSPTETRGRMKSSTSVISAEQAPMTCGMENESIFRRIVSLRSQQFSGGQESSVGKNRPSRRSTDGATPRDLIVFGKSQWCTWTR